MKTFGELNIGDELYSLNAMDAPWGSVTKYKITNLIKGPVFYTFEVFDDYYSEYREFRARPKTSVGTLAPSLEGVKEFWKREFNDKISKQEKEIERLKAGLVDLYDSLDKILKAEE